ncbi:MAG: Bax inhibitor-1/YccA family protein [Defluviitaleaceae bacterium]|nr:Bax inhibitor-1/YccA family protein [Defluviitaleaceae bacterium]
MNHHEYYDPENTVDITALEDYAINAYVTKVFGWMFLGLLITALTTVAIIVGTNLSMAFAQFIATALELIILVFIAEFALVFFLSARVHRMHPSTAKMLYVIYSILNGLTFGLVVYLFGATVVGMPTVAAAFGITAVSFGIMAIYGLTTHRDLTSMGNLLFMGLIGVIIAGVVNWFLGNTFLEFLILVGGLGIFLGLVAYHTHRIKNTYAQVALYGDNPDGSLTYEQEALASNLAIHGALTLYLAFINIFLRVLLILANRGRRR